MFGAREETSWGNCSKRLQIQGVSDRIRTGDRLDHNQELYQLSYAHRALSM